MINYQDSPADRKIRDTIVKNTLKDTKQGVLLAMGSHLRGRSVRIISFAEIFRLCESILAKFAEI
jgi:hypothetical protein